VDSSESEPGEGQRLVLRLVLLSILAFAAMVSYAIARPVTESLFLEHHGAEGLPWVWLHVIVATFVTVLVYARYVARVNLAWLYGAVCVLSALSHIVLITASRFDLPYSTYGLYIWKEIYVVLILECFYTYTNATLPIRLAKWAYGLFGVCGSLGSIVGNLAVGPLAQELGSSQILLFLPPLLGLMALISWPLKRVSTTPQAREKTEESGGMLEAIRIVRGSSYLVLMVVLVALTQIVITLIDYRFNQIIHVSFPDTDQRTAVIGQVYAGLSVATLAVHAMTGPILRLVGVPLVLLAVPLLLGAAIAAAAAPRLVPIIVVKIASKCFDYTLFRAAKEILYIPLGYREKTLGKSVVDMLTYRLAKGGASPLILGLIALGATSLLTPLTLVLVGLWIVVTVLIARRFRRKVSRSEEISGPEPPGAG